MEIQCKYCGSTIPWYNIDTRGQIAKCKKCNSLTILIDAPSSSSGKSRSEIRMPAGIKVRRDVSGLNMQISRFSRLISDKLTAVLVGGFLILMLHDVVTSVSNSYGLFAILLLFVGIYYAYPVLTGYFNRTYITVSPHSLEIRHGPIPARGDIRINSAEIKQVYSARWEIRDGYMYDLYAATSSGRIIELLRDFENKEQILYIEQEIERYLGIKDESMEWEIPR